VRARTALLFPGLGAYSAGMLLELAPEHPQVAATFREIDTTAAQYGVPSVGDVVLSGAPVPLGEILKLRTEIAQLAIFGASVTVHRILAAQAMRPHVLVGHSFGEMAALVAGGVFTIADGVRLVCARAKALSDWEGQGAMAAIGANESVTRHLIGALDEPDLAVACLNAPRQTVISGPVPAIERAERAAAALDLSFAKLQLPYASHHPSARPAMTVFLGLIADIDQKPLEIPVFSPVQGRRYTDADDIRQSIAECLVRPVLFTDAVRRLHSEGVSTFIECGALNALTRCVELTVPDVRTVAPLLGDEVAGLRLALGDERAAPVVPAARAPIEQPDRGAILARLRSLYAAALEYPEEVLTEEALLEAQLGIDSLKQTALLTRVVSEFGLSDDAGSLRAWDFPSLGRIADHILRAPAGISS
jgi:[acyl-carrier-protein] S-malonyltransferase